MNDTSILVLLYLGGVLGAYPWAWNGLREAYDITPSHRSWLTLRSALLWPLAQAHLFLQISGLLDWVEMRVDRYRAYRQYGRYDHFDSILLAFWPWPLVGLGLVAFVAGFWWSR